MVGRFSQAFPRAMPCTQGSIWRGDILVVDLQEVQENDASVVNAKRSNADEFLVPKERDNFTLQCASGAEK